MTIAAIILCSFSRGVNAKSYQNKKVSFKIKKGVLIIEGSGEMPDNMIFEGNKKITKVIIKKGITSIPCNAFNGCKRLKKVILPNGLKKIGDFAFGNTGLKKVKLPKSVTQIGTGAFSSDIKIHGMRKYNGIVSISVYGSNYKKGSNVPCYYVSWNRLKDATGYKIYIKDKTGKLKLYKKLKQNVDSILIEQNMVDRFSEIYVRPYKVLKSKTYYGYYGFTSEVYE